MNLTCCLCMYVASNETALEEHIDIDHAEIFRSVKPNDVFAGNGLDQVFGAPMSSIWNQMPSSMIKVGKKPTKGQAPSSPQVFLKSPAPMPTFGQFNADNSAVKVQAKRGRKPKNSVTAPELIPVSLTNEPVAPAKAQRGRKPKVSGLSVSLPLVGTPTPTPVESTWSRGIGQTSASATTSASTVTPAEMPKAETLMGKGNKRRLSTSVSRNSKRKSTESEAGVPTFEAEPKEETGFEATEVKTETQTLPVNPSQILTVDQNQQFLEIQLQVLRAENEDMKKKLEEKASSELNLANEVMTLKTELSKQVMIMSNYEDEKRNFEQLSSELAEIRTSSESDIQRLKSELEESAATNLDLESRLISLSEKCTELETSQQTYDSDMAKLRSEAEQSKSQTEGLYEIIRKKNAQMCQMKLNEERSELELKKLKKFETDYKTSFDRFNRIKEGLIKLFDQDESFCGDFGGKDAFKGVDGDDEVVEVVEHILNDYVSAKQRHLEDLHNYNKKIRDLKSLMQQKDQRFYDLTTKFNGKIDEVRCRMADVKKLATKLEIVTAEKEKASEKLQVVLVELEKSKGLQAEFETGTRKLLKDLKSSIDQKNQKIADLQKELAKPVKVDPKMVEKHVQKIGQLQLIEGHLKKKLAESKLQTSKLLAMVNVLQKLAFVTDEKASKTKQLLKENEQLKKEASFQNERFGLMIKNVQDMSEKVKATMARNDAEVKQLNNELKNKENLCNLLKKELENRNMIIC